MRERLSGSDRWLAGAIVSRLAQTRVGGAVLAIRASPATAA
jgi:hypothetical protein